MTSLFIDIVPNWIAFLGGCFATIVMVFIIHLIIRPSSPAVNGGLLFNVVFNNQNFSIYMMEIKNTQFVQGTLRAVDAKGDEAQIEAGSVQASSSNEEVATVEVDPNDEKKIKVTGQRAGACVVTVTADADLGEGVKQITAEVAVQVTAGEAVGFGIEFGEPQEQ